MSQAKNKKGRCGWIAPCILSFGLVVFVQTAVGGEEFIYDSKGRRSPFGRRAVQEVVEQKEDESIAADQETINRIRGMLTGVLWDSRNPIAYMKGLDKDIVEIGDIVEGWQIVDITKKSVVIEKRGRKVELSIHEEEEGESLF